MSSASPDSTDAGLSCPRCSETMTARAVGAVDVHSCPAGHGIFLDRIDKAELADAEAEWHRAASFVTQPLPRITADMTAPPPVASRGNAYVETLFG